MMHDADMIPEDQLRGILVILTPLFRELAHALNPNRTIIRDSDLAQEALLNAHQCPDQVRDGTPEQQRAWAWKVVVRTGAKMLYHMHRAKRDIAREQPLDDVRLEDCLADGRPTPLDEAQRSERAGRLAAALHELTDGQREVIRWHYLENLTLEEIAARLGISPPAVATRRNRGLLQLRQRLGLSDEP
jgi:RNA polymerase sigma-70 factor (subfamily 1)